MTRRSLSDMSTDELVDLFAENGIEQYRILLLNQVSKLKKVFGSMFEINAELKRRGTEARLALTQLYDHPNIQVQTQAALLTDDINPDGAKQVLLAIARSWHQPQAANARAALRDHYGLDESLWLK
jgi:hypothetical protein